MKKFKYANFLLPFLFVLIYSHATAETKIAFVQMELIINKSIVGKSLIKELGIIDKKNKKFFEDNQKKLNEKKKKNYCSKKYFIKRRI